MPIVVQRVHKVNIRVWLSFCQALSQKTDLKMAGMKNTANSREALSTSVSQTDGAVGEAGTSAQRPDVIG